MERGAGGQEGQIRRLVTAHLPGYRVRSIARLAEGQENVAYEVNGELIVRFSKEPDPVRRAARVDREARLLAAVAPISPLPVPAPELVAAEAGCLAYRKLPGLPLPDLPHQQLAPRAAQVAAGSRPCGDPCSPRCMRSPWPGWPAGWAPTTSRWPAGVTTPARTTGTPPARCRRRAAEPSGRSWPRPRRPARTRSCSRTTTSASNTCSPIPGPGPSPASWTGATPPSPIRRTTSGCSTVTGARRHATP